MTVQRSETVGFRLFIPAESLYKFVGMLEIYSIAYQIIPVQVSSAPNDLSTGTRRQFIALVGTTAGVALAGCTADDEETLEGESHISIRLANRDDVAYEYRIVVERGDPDQGDGSRHTSSGTIPAETTIEVGSTFRLTRDEHRYSIRAGEGQVGRIWDPVECPDYLVAAAVEDSSPSADGECRSE